MLRQLQAAGRGFPARAWQQRNIFTTTPKNWSRGVLVGYQGVSSMNTVRTILGWVIFLSATPQNTLVLNLRRRS